MLNISESDKLYSNIILDPFGLKDLRKLVVLYRQDFINSVLKISEHLKQHGGIHKKEGQLEKIYEEIRKKRELLRNLEYALDLAVNNDTEVLEWKNHLLSELNDREENDVNRIESQVNAIEKTAKKMSETDLLREIFKSLSLFNLKLEMKEKQAKRKEEWQMKPPEAINRDFEKEFKKQIAR